MMSDNLRSCPFCGPGELQTFHLGSLYFVQCVKCDTEQTGRTEADAAKAWNTRAALAAQPRDDVREALGAHIQADAYRDTMPDDDEDAAYLQKQETWWRLQARAWIGEETERDCAELAKKRATSTPEHKAAVAKAFACIDRALAPTTQGTDSGLAHDIERLVAANAELATENERLRTDRKAVLEEAAKVAREYVCKNQAWSTPAASLGDHIADEILAEGAGK